MDASASCFKRKVLLSSHENNLVYGSKLLPLLFSSFAGCALIDLALGRLQCCIPLRFDVCMCGWPHTLAESTTYVHIYISLHRHDICSTCSIIQNSCKTLIGVHEMHGRMHPN